MVIYRMSSNRDHSTKNCVIKRNARSCCPRLIRRTSVANLLLGLPVQIPSVASIFASCEYCSLYRYADADLTYSSSFMRIIHAENLIFLNMIGQVMSVEEYKL
jgi:hypothetical protein